MMQVDAPTTDAQTPGENVQGAGVSKPLQVMPGQAAAGNEKRLVRILDFRMIIPIVVIIFILIAAATTYYYIKHRHSAEEADSGIGSMPQVKKASEAGVAAPKPAYCEEAVADGTYPSEDSCFAALAIENRNVDYCYGVEDAKQRDGCFADLALKTMSQEYCYEMESLKGKGSFAQCLFDLALAKEDFLICLDITYTEGEFSSDHCVYEVAKTQPVDSVCEYIISDKDPYSVRACKAIVGSQITKYTGTKRG